MGLIVDHEKYEKIFIFVTFGLLIVNTIFFVSLPLLFVYSGFVIHMNFYIGCGYGYISLYKYFFVLQFSLASLAVRERFKILNDNLQVSLFNKNIKVFTVVKDTKSLKLFSKLYLDLCDSIETINETFTFHLFLVSLSSMVSLKKYTRSFKLNSFSSSFSQSSQDSELFTSFHVIQSFLISVFVLMEL